MLDLKANISFKDASYRLNYPYLVKVNDCYIGNRAIKTKGETYLIMGDKEDKTKYKERLNHSTFYPHFKQSINNFVNMIFRKGVEVDYKSKYKKLMQNVDGEGSDLYSVMKDAGKKACIDGYSLLWIDGPHVEGKMSYADREKSGFMPVIKVVSRLEVINKKFTVINGQKVLTLLVLEQEIENEGDGFEPVIEKCQIILEINKGTMIKPVEKKTTNGIETVNEVVTTWTNNLGFIPVIAVYSEKTGALEADIPFLDLAEQNIKHYNIQSTYDRNIRIVGNPLPILYGYAEDDADTANQSVVISSTEALHFETKETQGAEYLELEGKTLTHVENYIKETETKMDKMSLNVIYTDTFKTATEARYNEEKNNLFLVEVSNSLEYAFNKAFEIAGLFLGDDLMVDIKLSKEFIDNTLDPVMVSALKDLKGEGNISLDTLWDSLEKGEILKIKDREVEKDKISRENSEIV